jgi:hypothetical protein
VTMNTSPTSPPYPNTPPNSASLQKNSPSPPVEKVPAPPKTTPINRPDTNADDNLIRRGTSANAPVSSGDGQALHDLKLKTALFNLIPLLAPFKFLWDAAFFNPSKAAASRPDFLEGTRSYSSAVLQERREKNAQLKASLIPALAGLSLFILPTSIRGRNMFSPQRFIPAILVALGYGLFEKPDAPNFNQQL